MSETDTVPVVVFKKRKRPRKGQKRSLEEIQNDSKVANKDDEAENSQEKDEGTAVIKKQKQFGKGLVQKMKLLHNVDESKSDLVQDLAFSANRSAAPSGDSLATATNIIDGTMEERYRAENDKEAAEKAAEEAGPLGDGIYRGQAAYKKWTDDPDKNKSKTSRRGPVASSAYARMSCVFDYKPDICKDYKETGTCGYGDNCIYIHDRTDYKHGWQLEADWEAEQKAIAEGKNLNDDEKGEYYVGSDSEDDDDDGLPFACGICRKPFTSPIVTKCKHYFCEKCARKRFLKKKKKDCANCGALTDGVFNVAKDILKKAARLKAEAEKQEATEE